MSQYIFLYIYISLSLSIMYHISTGPATCKAIHTVSHAVQPFPASVSLLFSSSDNSRTVPTAFRAFTNPAQSAPSAMQSDLIKPPCCSGRAPCDPHVSHFGPRLRVPHQAGTRRHVRQNQHNNHTQTRTHRHTHTHFGPALAHTDTRQAPTRAHTDTRQAPTRAHTHTHTHSAHTRTHTQHPHAHAHATHARTHPHTHQRTQPYPPSYSQATSTAPRNSAHPDAAQSLASEGGPKRNGAAQEQEQREEPAFAPGSPHPASECP